MHIYSPVAQCHLAVGQTVQRQPAIAVQQLALALDGHPECGIGAYAFHRHQSVSQSRRGFHRGLGVSLGHPYAHTATDSRQSQCRSVLGVFCLRQGGIGRQVGAERVGTQRQMCLVYLHSAAIDQGLQRTAFVHRRSHLYRRQTAAYRIQCRQVAERGDRCEHCRIADGGHHRLDTLDERHQRHGRGCTHRQVRRIHVKGHHAVCRGFQARAGQVPYAVARFVQTHPDARLHRPAGTNAPTRRFHLTRQHQRRAVLHQCPEIDALHVHGGIVGLVVYVIIAAHLRPAAMVGRIGRHIQTHTLQVHRRGRQVGLRTPLVRTHMQSLTGDAIALYVGARGAVYRIHRYMQLLEVERKTPYLQPAGGIAVGAHVHRGFRRERTRTYMQVERSEGKMDVSQFAVRQFKAEAQRLLLLFRAVGLSLRVFTQIDAAIHIFQTQAVQRITPVGDVQRRTGHFQMTYGHIHTRRLDQSVGVESRLVQQQLFHLNRNRGDFAKIVKI